MLGLVGEFIGGLGIFVLAMRLMTDGLRAAVGENLRDILATWTSTTSRGILTGACITALVQSSSAVTVAVIGFVNAGLLSIANAMGIVFGANIGTTMTGWLVSLVGFNLNVEAFALPLIGIGTALWLIKQHSRAGGIGQAVLGFGLFFLGLSILKTAFEATAPSVNLQFIADYGALGVVLLVGIGSMITVLTQSSSAAVALTLTAASGGILSVPSAAAMVIGANIGTTSTAIFASIGATSNAKRIALGHILFNLITGAVALGVLPLMLWFISRAEQFLEVGGNVAVTLALFHTAFNVLGVLILTPFRARLSGWLVTRFRTAEEDISRPRFLDKSVVQTPVLALNAAYQELLRAAELGRSAALAALRPSAGSTQLISRNIHIIDLLRRAIDDFVKQLGRGRLSEEVANNLALAFRTGQTLAEVPRLASEALHIHQGMQKTRLTELLTQFNSLVEETTALVAASDSQGDDFSLHALKESLKQVEDRHDSIRRGLLLAGARTELPTDLLDQLLDDLIVLRRLARRLARLAARLDALRQAVEDEQTVGAEDGEELVSPGEEGLDDD